MRNILALVAVMSAVTLLADGCASNGTKSTIATGGSPRSQANNAARPATTSGSTPTPFSGGLLVGSKLSRFGTILAAGPKHLTVYRFEGDTGAVSHCYKACARTWPPVRTTGGPAVGGLAIPRDLGTITRSDGTKQVTYYNQPLYYYTKDKDSGDVYGHGVESFGARWYALRPGAATSPPVSGSTKP